MHFPILALVLTLAAVAADAASLPTRRSTAVATCRLLTTTSTILAVRSVPKIRDADVPMAWAVAAYFPVNVLWSYCNDISESYFVDEEGSDAQRQAPRQEAAV
ncbi:hypothetical protein HKX48_007301 [Thoreauomyces humboldtii]|nr:hypothetical protein HKX48_007301 [Thoreauomyces humboldtii]